MTTTSRYIHAFGPAILTRFYDPLIRLLREDEFKGRLVDLAQIQSGHRVLDVGCGTGTLAMLIQKRQPDAEVHGVDGDPKILEIARAKVAQAGASVAFERAMAWELPYPDGTFDRVVSSLVFHHLITNDKRRAAREILRVLRPGGTLLLADFGPPRTIPGKAIALALRWFEEASDNLAGRLPGLLMDSGFCDVVEIDRFQTYIGPIAYLQGRKRKDDDSQ
jgi:ubiquinone/menaquinone biosynthesis C-methylase UbiE